MMADQAMGEKVKEKEMKAVGACRAAHVFSMAIAILDSEALSYSLAWPDSHKKI